MSSNGSGGGPVPGIGGHDAVGVGGAGGNAGGQESSGGVAGGGMSGANGASVQTLSLLAGKIGEPAIADGTGPDARLNNVRGLVNDGAGNMFFADGGTIRKVVIATGVVTTIAGSPGALGTADGTGSAARFYFPKGVATDGAGNLYVVDNGYSTIRKVVIATGVVTTFAGSPVIDLSMGPNFKNRDGIGTAARFDYPTSITSDGAGNLFVADSYNHAIRKVVIATAEVTTFVRGFDSAGNGPPTIGFALLSAIASDGAGNLFVADSDINALPGNATLKNVVQQVVIATGVVTILAGSPGTFGSVDDTGPAATFKALLGVAPDGAGNLFVADFGNSTIRKVVIATGVVTTPVGIPDQPAVILGPLPGGLNHPTSIAVGTDGSLFIGTGGAILRVH